MTEEFRITAVQESEKALKLTSRTGSRTLAGHGLNECELIKSLSSPHTDVLCSVIHTLKLPSPFRLAADTPSPR